MQKRVLCLVVNGFEEVELIAPVDLLRRAGVEVVLAALHHAELATGRCQVAIRTDTSLDRVQPGEFDVLLIPGGPGVKTLRADGRPATLAREFVQAGKWVGAICAAPLVLADGGLLAGRKYTAHFSTQAELPHALAAERVVVDRPILTSRGAGTAVEFGLALVTQLCGEASAREVAQAIMM